MEVLVLVALFLLNGLFAMSEMAMVSSRRVRLQQRADEGDRGARAALAVIDDPGPFLSTIQVGITLIGILSGAFGGATVTASLADVLVGVPALAPYAQPIALATVVIGITFASLIVGELVPKRIALHAAERIASRVALPMRVLSKVMHPFVVLLTRTSEVVLRLFGIRERVRETVTEAEIEGLMREGAAAGVFEQAESRFVSRVLRLDAQRIGAIMTPRGDMVALDVEAPLAENLAVIRREGVRRLPVVRGDFHEVIGILDTVDLLERYIDGQPVDLAALVRPAVFVPEGIHVIRLLELLEEQKADLALVVDEYGEVEGLVTTTDVFEAIVGDLPDADPDEVPEVVRREDGSLLVDGSISLQRLREAIGREIEIPEAERDSYHTLGGFVLARLGHVPHAGDHFRFDGFRFEVLDMDRNRIDKVLVAAADADAEDRQG